MTFLSKIKLRFAAFMTDWRTRRHAEHIDRSDVLLAHRVVARRRLPTLRQWRLVGRVLKPQERRTMLLAAYAIILGLALIGARWALAHATFVPSSGGEYREGVVGAPRAINPILAGGNDVDQDIVRLVYSGLYRRDNNGQLSLDLAQKAAVSADGKTYTFTLKNDVFFHDGQPVTADDIVFTIKAILDPAWKSPLAGALAGVTAIASGAQTVTVSANQPASYLPSLLTFGILPQHVWADVNPNSRAITDFNLKPIGSGPFKFEKFTRDQQGNILTYTLRAAKNSGVMLDRITFKFFDDYDTAVDKLTSNAVDGLNFVPPGKQASIKTIPGVTIHKPALSQYTAVFLNPQNNAALADVNVRQALAYAIDREKIIKTALGGLGTLRDQPIPDGATGSTPGVTRYAYDPALAGSLLDKAGFVVSPDTKIRTKSQTSKPASKKEKPVTTTTELSISLATIDTEENRQAAEIIKTAWTALGIKVDLVAAAGADIQKSIIRPREYDALLFGEILGPDSDPYPFWDSSQIANGLNLAAYSNRRVDELLEKARLAPNDAARGTLLAEFQQIITKEEPAIFLYQPAYLYPQSDKIKDFKVAMVTAPADRFANVKAWYRQFKLAFK